MAIGVDIEDINRFKGKSQKFLDRIFTPEEQDYCLSKSIPNGHFAVRFCAKEAVTKALNSIGIKHPNYNEIEIYHDNNGCPKVNLPDKKQFKGLKIDVSLSHDKSKAIAFVMISKEI